jgi:YVTN family beta-propeller protein
MKKIALVIGFAALMCAVAVSCKKDNNESTEQNSLAKDIVAAEEGTDARYIYILNEGVWGGNDASLDRIAVATGEYQSDVFASKNGRGLGDVANDIQIYGRKMYIVVNSSNIVEVLDPDNARSVRQIQLAGKQPRYLVGHKGYVYITCYSDDVLKIDTSTLSVVATCNVGRDPEMLAVIGDTLYTVNSGGLDNPNYDSTVSVVDLATFTEVRKINVGMNPTKIVKIDNNRLMVVCNGNYGSVPSSLAVIDLGVERVTRLLFTCTNLTVAGNYAYCYDFDWSAMTAVFYRVNLGTLAKENFTLNGSDDIVCPYGIAVNKDNGNIYLTDSQNFISSGDFYCFSSAGAKLYKCGCGMGPSKVVMW